jgi:hypothetical protein
VGDYGIHTYILFLNFSLRNARYLWKVFTDNKRDDEARFGEFGRFGADGAGKVAKMIGVFGKTLIQLDLWENCEATEERGSESPRGSTSFGERVRVRGRLNPQRA